jgi:outer membrane protein
MKLTLLGLCLGFLVFQANSQTIGTEKSERPLYEVGVGAAALSLPDYPGSDRSRLRTIALPYSIYRGRFLRADEDGGLRGRFFDHERWDLDFSAGAGFPASSRENRAREDMPDLDWIGRLGPRLRYRFLKREVRDQFRFDLPLQAVFSTDFTRVDGRGFVALPSLQYIYHGLLTGRLRLVATTRAVLSARPLMDYFYTVQTRYANESRPAYSAREGLIEFRHTIGAVWTISPQYILAASFGLNDLSMARNKESPLLRTETTTVVAVGLIWRIFASSDKAYR